MVIKGIFIASALHSTVCEGQCDNGKLREYSLLNIFFFKRAYMLLNSLCYVYSLESLVSS